MHQNTEPFISDYAKGLKAEGKAEGKREDLLKILKLRGLSCSQAQEAKVLQCNDLDQLERWLETSLRVSSVFDLLGL